MKRYHNHLPRFLLVKNTLLLQMKKGNKKILLLKFITSKEGLAQMKENGLFDDKTGPHLAPINRLPKNRKDVLGSGGGADDISSLYTGEDFYKAQGLDIDSIPTTFQRIAETQTVGAEDATVLEGIIWLPLVNGRTSYSN